MIVTKTFDLKMPADGVFWLGSFSVILDACRKQLFCATLIIKKDDLVSNFDD